MDDATEIDDTEDLPDLKSSDNENVPYVVPVSQEKPNENACATCLEVPVLRSDIPTCKCNRCKVIQHSIVISDISV